MLPDNALRAAIGGLFAVGARDDWKGYDPYDALLSPVSTILNRPLRIVWTQIFKRLPFNLRPFPAPTGPSWAIPQAR